MSGGTYNYLHSDVYDLAIQLKDYALTAPQLSPKERAYRLVFAELVWRVAEAAYKIDWVDSGDSDEGSEMAAIKYALEFSPETEMQNIIGEKLEDLHNMLSVMRERQGEQ